MIMWVAWKRIKATADHRSAVCHHCNATNVDCIHLISLYSIHSIIFGTVSLGPSDSTSFLQQPPTLFPTLFECSQTELLFSERSGSLTRLSSLVVWECQGGVNGFGERGCVCCVESYLLATSWREIMLWRKVDSGQALKGWLAFKLDIILDSSPQHWSSLSGTGQQAVCRKK